MAPTFISTGSPSPLCLSTHLCRLLAPALDILRGDVLAQRDRLEHRAVAVARTTHVVHLGFAGRAIELMERRDKVGAVDVVADLLALVAEDRVGLAGAHAFHQICQKAVE